MRDDSVTSALEAAASSPKVATVVAGGTVAAGAASRLDIIQGWLAVGSMTVGMVTAIAVLGIQLIRLERAWRSRNLPLNPEKE